MLDCSHRQIRGQNLSEQVRIAILACITYAPQHTATVKHAHQLLIAPHHFLQAITPYTQMHCKAIPTAKWGVIISVQKFQVYKYLGFDLPVGLCSLSTITISALALVVETRTLPSLDSKLIRTWKVSLPSAILSSTMPMDVCRDCRSPEKTNGKFTRL